MDKDAALDRADDLLDRSERIYEDHGKVFRILWVSVGVIVVLAGLAMIVFPGPVTIVVPLGLVLLAAAFGWARRLLHRSVRAGVDATNAMADASGWTKALAWLASACVAAAVIAFVVL
jgi:small-conductance mechanosensitive channel